MSDESERNLHTCEQLSSVGYKRPPVATRFQKGCSGNPAGRPSKKTAPIASRYSVKDVEALMLEEAYRPVSIREGDKVIQLPTIQAVMRGLGVAAIKGNHRAQLAFKQHTQAIEAKRLVERLELFENFMNYKAKWKEEFERCERSGLPPPNQLPHPDDIQLDVRMGEVRFLGPLDQFQKAQWDKVHAVKQDSLEEINRLRMFMKNTPRLRKILEREIAVEQHGIDVIDYYLPDEATRRHPHYDPRKKGKAPPWEIKFGTLAKPAAPATKVAARRRSKDPEG